MRQVSLEQFNQRIENRIKLVAIHTRRRLLPALIKSCRLRPASIHDGSFSRHIRLETLWVDEFDRAIRVANKEITVVSHSFTTIATDLYRNLSLPSAVERGQWLILNLKDEILVLMGGDGYLRAFRRVEGRWQICSPLLFGLEALEYCLVPAQIAEGTVLISGDEYLVLKLPLRELKTEIRSILFNG